MSRAERRREMRGQEKKKSPSNDNRPDPADEKGHGRSDRR